MPLDKGSAYAENTHVVTVSSSCLAELVAAVLFNFMCLDFVEIVVVAVLLLLLINTTMTTVKSDY